MQSKPIQEPGKPTNVIRQLAKRATSNQRFGQLVTQLRRLIAEATISPAWLTDAARLAAYLEVRRLYKAAQCTNSKSKPKREPPSAV
jgi:hypothetical protein